MKRICRMRCLFLVIIYFGCATVFAETWTIGATPNDPPLASLSDGKNHFYGFELDIMNTICDRLHVKCVYRSVDAVNVVSELSSKGIDIAMAAIIVPPKPLAGFIFSSKYLESHGQFMTLASSNINTPKDLFNKTIGIRHGALGYGGLYQYLIVHESQYKFKLKPYLLLSDLMNGLSNNEVDAVFSLETLLKYWYFNNSGLYKLIGEPILVGGGYAFMATEQQKALIDQVNVELAKMRADGTYDNIYSRYFSNFQ